MALFVRCVSLLGILGASWAQREVTVQQGTLYRTVGTNITIWCRVSGYKGSSHQNFLWSIYLPSAPEREVQIVSTNDKSFSYAIYSQRVSSGDIYVERVAGDHTRLHITQLQERDTGEYECHTPTTDPTYHGSYSAKMNLIVIPDTVKVMMTPQDLSKTEGDPLELTCDVSKASSQHTHLSVTFLLSSGESPEIITLSRDFVLEPGPKYSGRFSSGDVRLDKLGDTTYRLQIRGLQDSDQGEVICQASEWIQDPDGTWTEITKRQSEKTKVTVSSVKGEDFEVQIQAPDGPLAIGSPLEVTCSISAQGLAGRSFQVTWLLNNTKLVTLSSSGIPSFEKQIGPRKTPGQVTVGRRSPDTWYLWINQVQMEDIGTYMCLVMEQERRQPGTGSRQSREVTVTMAESAPEVLLSSDVSQVYEGDSVNLTCEVTRFLGSLSLVWFLIRSSGQWMEMVSLQRDGELTISQSHSGKLEVDKLGRGLFTLKMSSVTETGRYGCRVTEWAPGPDGGWQNLTVHSRDRTINVTPLSSSLSSSLSVRNPKVKISDTVSLFCKATAEYSLSHRNLQWTWQFLPRRDNPGNDQMLVHMSQNGSMSWGDSLPSFHGKAQLWVSEGATTLRIYRVQRGQSGSFSCTVGVLNKETGDTQASATSNRVTIQVTAPDSLLKLDTAAHSMVVTSGQDKLTVRCPLLAVTRGAPHSVSWFFQPPSAPSPQEILSVSREGVLSRSTPSLRFLSERVSETTYLLHIQRPDPGQRGSFYCRVQEWLLEENGTWTSLGESMSGVTNVDFRLSDTNLNISKTNRSVEVIETEDAELHCPLGVVPSVASLYSVSWYYHGSDSGQSSLLYRAGWAGLTQYKQSMAKRLQLVATERGNYSLIILSVGLEDAGTYHCQVEEWRQIVAGGDWRMEASDVSGFLELTVSAPAHNLSLDVTEVTLSVPQAQQSITLPCQVLSITSSGSALSVTWWKSLGHLVFSVSHDGLFNYSREGDPGDDRLKFERLSEMNFQLRILRPQVTDTGVYHCSVQEWVQRPRGVWYPRTESRAGNIAVTVHPAGYSFISQVCSSPSLFHFFMVYPLLLLILVAVLVWVYLRVRRKRRGGTYCSTQQKLWTPMHPTSIPITNGAEDEVGKPDVD
ncbi:immunoglobulin superfamily member 3-like [Discoglossus pictus]